jgi:hypothetical protein
MKTISLEEFERRHHPMHDEGEQIHQFDLDIRSGMRFIVTAAQNATPVHPEWWSCLTGMAKAKDAQLVVIPLRYKNPTSRWTGSQRNDDYWVSAVMPYLFNGRHEFNKNLMLLGDIKIQPTASSPLTGSDALSFASSGIIGHTKMQLRSIATPSNRMAKILTTTGACTVENYTDSRAGKTGEFHHSLSAIMVEVVGSKFFLRQLHFDKKTKSCTDIGMQYFADGSFGVAPRALALVMGDTHVDFVDPGVEHATWGRNGIVEVIRPEHVVWHDTLDAYSCSPHHAGDPFIARAKQMSGRHNVRAEVERAIQYVATHTSDHFKSIVIASNHDDMLARWVKRHDWKTDPSNAEFYLELALRMHRGTRMTDHGTEHPDPFAMLLREANIPTLRVLDLDESFVLGNVELSMHGDKGPNGARGSIKNIRRLGIRSIIGHSHIYGIDEGCYQGGTSSRLRQDWNHGASAWLNVHILLNHDGKRQGLVMIEGLWRGV